MSFNVKTIVFAALSPLTIMLCISASALLLESLVKIVEIRWAEKVISGLKKLSKTLVWISPAALLIIIYIRIFYNIEISTDSGIANENIILLYNNPYNFSIRYFAYFFILTLFAYLTNRNIERRKSFYIFMAAGVFLTLNIFFADVSTFAGISLPIESGGMFNISGGLAGAISALILISTFSENKPDKYTRRKFGYYLFGFVAFRAYIAYSQYLIVSYIEVDNFAPPFADASSFWNYVSMSTIYIAPLTLLITRTWKESRIILTASSIAVLAGLFVESFNMFVYG